MGSTSVSSQLVFPDQAPPAVEAAVKSILQSQPSGTIPATPDVFVRIVRLDAILHDGQIPADAYLAGPNGPPVVFLTIPEEIAKSPGTVLSRIGYTDADLAYVFGGGQAAAIVFKYPDEVQSLPTRDGDLSSDVLKRVVRGTWQNLFRTYKDIAEIDESPLQFGADDRRFVASFPSWGQLRLMGVPSYSEIQSVGGADCVIAGSLKGTSGSLRSTSGQGGPPPEMAVRVHLSILVRMQVFLVSRPRRASQLCRSKGGSDSSAPWKESLQPVAIGAAAEVTKPSRPRAASAARRAGRP